MTIALSAIGWPTFAVSFLSPSTFDNRVFARVSGLLDTGAERAGFRPIRRCRSCSPDAAWHSPSRLSLRGERPDHLVGFGKGVRDANPEHEPVAARLEVRRLPEIGPARLKVIVWTDRNVDLFPSSDSCSRTESGGTRRRPLPSFTATGETF